MLVRVSGQVAEAREVMGKVLAADPTNRALLHAYLTFEFECGEDGAEARVRAAYEQALKAHGVGEGGVAAGVKAGADVKEIAALLLDMIDFELDRGTDVARAREVQARYADVKLLTLKRAVAAAAAAAADEDDEDASYCCPLTPPYAAVPP